MTLLGTFALLGISLLFALGVWQVERRAWKLDLIASVDARIHAAPIPAPGPQKWSSINASDDAYRHVVVTGRFLDSFETLAKAVTELGSGYWVLAPFKTDAGFSVFINRGFIPDEQRAGAGQRLPPRNETTVTGLLRVTEPKGGFLRRNDPASDHWFSRDIAAIAAARGVEGAAPYFIDADASSGEVAFPRGGLTVVTFPNNHLVYALTWFGLAAMLAGWAFYAARLEWALRKKRAGSAKIQSG
ncbi:MAG: SURF1 family protein [Xanthobacteraceae bacterium]|nr:SURF1 family protein [Xanthobacteraceae bacterium]